VEDGSLAFTSVVRKPNGKLVSLALLGGVALTAGGPAQTAAHAQAARTWLTITRPMLCQITIAPPTFTRRCTTKWYLDNRGNIITDDPNWVPALSPADTSEAALTWPHDFPGTVSGRARLYAPPLPKPAPVQHSQPVVRPLVQIVSGPYDLWTPPPGHPAYALPEYANDPNAGYYGTCTWYAEYRRPDEPLARLGGAAQWAWNATAYGLRVGTTPAVGATVVFQQGVLGAGAGGHVGHVEAVYGGGWFLISEMNMAWNGGGWGRVSFRYAVVMPGVSFVY
jgi:surface antigen